MNVSLQYPGIAGLNLFIIIFVLSDNLEAMMLVEFAGVLVGDLHVEIDLGNPWFGR